MSSEADVSIDPPRAGFESRDSARMWELLRDADASFIPPLSARNSTVQQQLGGNDADDLADVDVRGPLVYFESLRSQNFFLARDGHGAVIAFMSFRTGYTLPAADRCERYHYVTTVIVDPRHRRQGITRRMYELLIAEAAAHGEGVATRTWSTNDAHLALLETIDFTVVIRRPDDRGTGIDTVYLARELGRSEGAA